MNLIMWPHAHLPRIERPPPPHHAPPTPVFERVFVCHRSVGDNRGISFRQLQEFWARWRRPQASGVGKQTADSEKPLAPNHTTSFGGHRIDANSLEAYTPRNPPTNPHTHTHTHTHTHIIFNLHTCKRVRTFLYSNMITMYGRKFQ
jgi:hypothetical protein